MKQPTKYTTKCVMEKKLFSPSPFFYFQRLPETYYFKIDDYFASFAVAR